VGARTAESGIRYLRSHLSEGKVPGLRITLPTTAALKDHFHCLQVPIRLVGAIHIQDDPIYRNRDGHAWLQLVENVAQLIQVHIKSSYGFRCCATARYPAACGKFANAMVAVPLTSSFDITEQPITGLTF
jgi:hypothetical protein